MKTIPEFLSREFVAQVASVMAGFREAAGSLMDRGSRVWEVATGCGNLTVEVYVQQCSLYTVFMRFRGDCTSAVALLGGEVVNPHSGKWNIHCANAADAVKELQGRLRRVDAKVAA